jgi:hypothetical protein
VVNIDASIKAGDPDLSLFEEALRLADNDPLIMLRSLAIKIQELEVNRLNDIKVNEVLDDICMTGREVEEKIYEKFKINNDTSRFNEDKDYLEECFEQFAHICERKKIYPDIEFRSTDIARKTGFSINKEEAIESSEKEIKMQKTIFSELRGVKDASKKARLDWMKQKYMNVI